MEQLLFDKMGDDFPFTLILDNIDAGIAVYDAQGNFIFVNTVMINWRNIPRKEYLQMNVHDFTGFIDVCVFDLVMQEKRRISRLQYYRDVQKIDGPTRMRIVVGTPILDGFGNIKYVITMLQDVADFESQYQSLLKENKILSETQPATGPSAEAVSIVAKSGEMRHLLSVADTIAPLDSTILIYGESGSGKEVIARYIHQHSDRKSKPMITVNCAAFPENLIEAELFGYEKGSFTGASREGKMGLAEAADGGTLFLDEINSLPLGVQGKVLRMIEEKSVQRIGAIRPRKVNFRLITATNQQLGELVRGGQFREDLYYRLHVIPLTIPPLRSRQDDIAPLCLHFLHYYCQKYNLNKSFSDEVLEVMRGYDWPGNVRELRNFVERMVVMTPYAITEICNVPTDMLEGSYAQFKPTATPIPMTALSQPAVQVPTSRGSLDRETILSALERCNNHRGKTAEMLGISRRYLQYKLQEYQIPNRYRRT